MCNIRLSLAGAGRISSARSGMAGLVMGGVLLRSRRPVVGVCGLLAKLAWLPVLDHQGDVEVLAAQFDALRQAIAALLDVAQVLQLPAVLLQARQVAVAVEGDAAAAVWRGQAAYPPEQVGNRQTPAELLFQQGFRRFGLVAALVGHF